jgi:phosphatidylserine decarboxylase
MPRTFTTTTSRPTLAQAIAGGAPALGHPPVETTGRGLLTLEDAGPVQMGFWVPNRVYATAKFVAPLRKHVATLRDSRILIALDPAVQEFKNWVTGNSVYRMWANLMMEQANAFVATLDPTTQAYIRDTCGDSLFIGGYDEFFDILSVIVQESPSFNDTVQVGTPMNGFLAVSMGTQAGAGLFHDTLFNQQFKKVLDAWNAFLKRPASLDKLDINNPEKPGSWISQAAWDAGVWKDVQFNQGAPGYGFDSWNSFFIRPFVDGARPFQGDASMVVNIGCETTPWTYVNNVADETDFWVKDYQYSLFDLFGGDESKAALFDGGQVYQGFLSATHYHRWNSPITGELVAAWVEPGTYFAQRPTQGENVGTWEGTESQPYLGHVATRAIFLFNHPACGYVAMILIGMVEVSTCVINPPFQMKPGDEPIPITRGTEIGHFEFGGSTHILLFQKGKVGLAQWALDAQQHQNDPQPTPMGTVIAVASNAP